MCPKSTVSSVVNVFWVIFFPDTDAHNYKTKSFTFTFTYRYTCMYMHAY